MPHDLNLLSSIQRDFDIVPKLKDSNYQVMGLLQFNWSHIYHSYWCMISFLGRQYQEGQAVYPDQGTERTGVFPDGTPFTRNQSKKSHYVFVWKTWGKDLIIISV